MTAKLFVQAIGKFLLGAVITGLMIFLPAGTLSFCNGWIFMGLLFIPMFLAGLVLMFADPTLLAKRLQAKESRKEQGLMVKLSGLMFLAGFVMAGLNFRFGWHTLSEQVSIVACFIFLFAYALYGEVLRENAYLSRTIRVEVGQKVIDTGLYSIVRHPMYTATVFLFLSMPLVLGSLYAFFIFLLYLPLIAARIKDEEHLLERELEGYAAYKQKVTYRLIPYIW